MLDTFLSLVVAAGAVLPGFVAAELTQRGRAVTASGDSQSTLLHAMFYAMVIHLGWSWWTWELAQDLTGGHWEDHLGQVAMWTAVVLLVSPIVVGLAINKALRDAEERGPLSWWHYALGGRDARDAWDFAFQRAATLVHGCWCI